MRSLESDDLIRLRPTVALYADQEERVFLRDGAMTIALPSVGAGRYLSLVDLLRAGPAPVSVVEERLDVSPAEARSWLEALTDLLVTREARKGPHAVATEGGSEPLSVVLYCRTDSPFGLHIATALKAHGVAVDIAVARAAASTPVPGPAIRRLWQGDSQAPVRGLGADTVPVGAGTSSAPAGQRALALVALDGVAASDALAIADDLWRRGVPALYAASAGAGQVGPLAVPGASACFRCARETIDWPRHVPVAAAVSDAFVANQNFADSTELPAASLRQLAARVAYEVTSFRDAPESVTLAGAVEAVGRSGIERRWVRRRSDCSVCAAQQAPTAARATLAADFATVRSQFLLPTESGIRRASEYKKVIVVGGGTAGFLTALTLRACRPELDVTLIESSKIPVIGVGEATTSELPPFLHRVLGFDVQDFYAEVKPTWKLGIRFEWGHEQPFFNYPFDLGNTLEAMTYDGHLGNVSLLSALMAADRSPIVRDENGEYVSLMREVPFAYHLDNRRFVAYLKREALRRGIRYVDVELNGADVSPDHGEIRSLSAADGRSFTADLFIDCSGFRSWLLEDKLKSPFHSYSSTLFNDTAVVASRPHDGLVRPYTTAEAMENGWCWNIPQVDEDHRGYVFSSAFCSIEQAAAEMRLKNPRMGDYWTVKFRSGRHEHFWKGNVVAIGNSYGFVEPLESTAIQVIIYEAEMLARHLPAFKGDTTTIEGLNREVGSYWDYIRAFLGVHFKFNERFDNRYWRACRSDTVIDGANEVLAQYDATGPLVEGSAGVIRNRTLGGRTFNNFGFDMMLLGQGRRPRRMPRPVGSRAAFEARVAAYRRLSAAALPQAEALDVLLHRRPDLLDQFVNRGGWIDQFADRYRDLAPLRTSCASFQENT